MEPRELRRIVERHVEPMMKAMGLGHWRVTVSYDLHERGEGFERTAARCQILGDYNQAWIQFDPESFDGEAEALRVLRHELLHLLLSPYELFREAAEPLWRGNPRLAETLARVWNHACEKAVVNLERMHFALTTSEGRKMSVKKVGKGYENVSKSGQKMSKKPLTKSDALAQDRAINASKNAKKGK